MLKASEIDDGAYVEDCLRALKRLEDAHKVRNRIAHDQWILRQETPGQYVAARVPKGVAKPTAVPEADWNLADFRRCYEELRARLAKHLPDVDQGDDA